MCVVWEARQQHFLCLLHAEAVVHISPLTSDGPDPAMQVLTETTHPGDCLRREEKLLTALPFSCHSVCVCAVCVCTRASVRWRQAYVYAHVYVYACGGQELIQSSLITLSHTHMLRDSLLLLGPRVHGFS